jgi:hypothetical protein
MHVNLGLGLSDQGPSRLGEFVHGLFEGARQRPDFVGPGSAKSSLAPLSGLPACRIRTRRLVSLRTGSTKFRCTDQKPNTSAPSATIRTRGVTTQARSELRRRSCRAPERAA